MFHFPYPISLKNEALALFLHDAFVDSRTSSKSKYME